MTTKKMVSFRFTPDVIELLKRKASEKGMTVTAFIKHLIIAEVFK